MIPPDPENFARTDVNWERDEYETTVRDAWEARLREIAEAVPYPTPEEKSAHVRALMNRQQRRHGDDWEPPEKWRP